MVVQELTCEPDELHPLHVASIPAVTLELDAVTVTAVTVTAVTLIEMVTITVMITAMVSVMVVVLVARSQGPGEVGSRSG